MANYPVIFCDNSEKPLAPAIGRDLGLYQADLGAPAGQKLSRETRFSGGDWVHVKDLVVFAKAHGYMQVCLLTCKNGPSIVFSGSHVPEGVCKEGWCDLEFKAYEDLTLEHTLCLTCGAHFDGDKLTFNDCRFKLRAKCRPHPDKHVHFPLGEHSRDQDGWALAETRLGPVVVDLNNPGGVVRLRMEAGLTERN